MPTDKILCKFFNAGLSREELQHSLASNAVLEWFGKTFRGRREIVNFYTGSHRNYKPNFPNGESTVPFECRPTHLTTRKEPIENFVRITSQSETSEQLCDYDKAESSMDVNMRESLYRTPPQRPNAFIECPPAPCRKSLIYSVGPDDQQESHSSDECNSDNDCELGVCPIDSASAALLGKLRDCSTQEIKKKPRIEKTDIEQGTGDSSSSKYSDLFYVESLGKMVVEQPASLSSSSSSLRSFSFEDQEDKRDVQLLLSYRRRKDNPDDIQIALIIYKSVGSKPRRNLLNEFTDEIVEHGAALPHTPMAVASQCFTASSEQLDSPKSETKESIRSGEQVKRATKRPLVSRGCLRF